MSRKRLVVKIGSSSLTNDKGQLDEEKLKEHVEALVQLKKAGHDVILVSSGAVACGFSLLGYPARPTTMVGKQAAAAIGQTLLMKHYQEHFSKHNMTTAQLLLTRNNFRHKDQYQNSYQTLTELLKRSVIPIINENDSVSVEELTFGDNDQLAALVSGTVSADLLILLTDVKGLYDQNPHTHPYAKPIPFLSDIPDEILELGRESGSKVGTGGMRSKLVAAKIALKLGVASFIGTGTGSHKLLAILNGEGEGTYIGHSTRSWLNNTKQWVALHSRPAGKLFIDNGAEEAIIHHGKSLLPAGVYQVTGRFQPGEVVEIYNDHNQVIGRGEVRYPADTIEQYIKARRTGALEKTMTLDEVIHRNHMVILNKGEVNHE